MKCQAVCEVNAQLVTSIINANKGLHDCKWFFLNRHKKMLILEKVIVFFFCFFFAHCYCCCIIIIITVIENVIALVLFLVFLL